MNHNFRKINAFSSILNYFKLFDHLIYYQPFFYNRTSIIRKSINVFFIIKL